jgi:hypothetical protein
LNDPEVNSDGRVKVADSYNRLHDVISKNFGRISAEQFHRHNINNCETAEELPRLEGVEKLEEIVKGHSLVIY